MPIFLCSDLQTTTDPYDNNLAERLLLFGTLVPMSLPGGEGGRIKLLRKKIKWGRGEGKG